MTIPSETGILNPLFLSIMSTYLFKDFVVTDGCIRFLSSSNSNKFLLQFFLKKLRESTHEEFILEFDEVHNTTLLHCITNQRFVPSIVALVEKEIGNITHIRDIHENNS